RARTFYISRHIANPYVLAIVAIDERYDPHYLIDLLASGKPVPPEAMPYLKDAFDRWFCKHEKGHHSRPPYYTSPTEVAAYLVGYLVERGYLVAEAIDEVSKFMGDSDTIANFYNSRSGHSRRIKKARRQK